MDWLDVQKHWKEYKSQFKNKFSKLSNADLEEVAGRKELLTSKLQEVYGISETTANDQIAACCIGLVPFNESTGAEHSKGRQSVSQIA
jgi:uncharacterized protein YjbJ (UPF0337 family)